MPKQSILLAFFDGQDFCSLFIPALSLCQPCPFQQVSLAILGPMFLEIVVLLVTNLQVNLELCHCDSKGVFNVLDASRLLEVNPIFIATQLIFHKQMIYLLVLNPNDQFRGEAYPA